MRFNPDTGTVNPKVSFLTIEQAQVAAGQYGPTINVFPCSKRNKGCPNVRHWHLGNRENRLARKQKKRRKNKKQ
jgi:hypothetical protein